MRPSLSHPDIGVITLQAAPICLKRSMWAQPSAEFTMDAAPSRLPVCFTAILLVLLSTQRTNLMVNEFNIHVDSNSLVSHQVFVHQTHTPVWSVFVSPSVGVCVFVCVRDGWE